MPTPDEKLPLVSVCMGVRYRREDLSLLERSIRSIQAQSYSNWELLICERDSIPAAKERLNCFEQEDPRIQILDGTDTVGLQGQLNRCLKVAKGDWIARMDDDDVSAPDRLSVQMAYLQEHSEAAFVGGVAKLERDGNPAGMRRLPEKPTVRDFLFVQPFLHPTLLFRREALEVVGGYCEETRCLGCEDYDLLLRLYERGLVGANIQEPLFTYTLPPLGSKKLTMALRWNEVRTRYVRFKSLGLLPGAFPYVVKPVAVGLIPNRMLEWMKKKRTGE